ncbi:hypothetical protein D3C71_1955720 [compost metagenome]
MGVLLGQMLLQLAGSDAVSAGCNGNGGSSQFVSQPGENLDGQLHGAPPENERQDPAI